MTPKLLLKIDEVSEATGWGRTFIYERLKAGDLKAVKVGRSVRVSMESLQEFIRRHASTPLVDPTLR